MAFWSNLVNVVTGPIAEAYKSRNERLIKEKELRDAAHARVLEAISKEKELEQAVTLAQLAKNDWRDDWFTYLFSIPLIGAFIPFAVPYILKGFAVLDTMPVWYKVYLGSAVSAAFGLSVVDKAWKWWTRP